MPSRIVPVFIFSLPRSGSTLLQRILISHKEINSTSEPWLLLPLLTLLKKEGTISNYSYINSTKGISDFIDVLPEGKETFHTHLREFILNLYNDQSCEKHRYFIDKTPRYYLIIDEIKELLPNSKFIFLFRNPVQIYSSILNTWCDNKFYNFHNYMIDLEIGFEKLSRGYKKYKTDSLSINYEILVKNPDQEFNRVMDFLSIETTESIDTYSLSTNLRGRMGDPTGTKEYDVITEKTTFKWKKTFDSYFRKYILLKFIKSLNNELFDIQGYDKNEIIIQIKNLNTSFKARFVIDVIQYMRTKIIYETKKFLYKNRTYNKNKT